MSRAFALPTQRMQRGPAELDPLLLWPAAGLLLFGLVMVYSSSIAMAEVSKFTGGRANYFLLRHILFVFIGLVAAGLSLFMYVSFMINTAIKGP